MSSLRRLLVHVGDNGLDELLVRFAARLAAHPVAELKAVHAVEPLSLGACLSSEAAMTAAEANQHLNRERCARARERVHSASQGVGREVDKPASRASRREAMLSGSESGNILFKHVGRDQYDAALGDVEACPVLLG